MRDLIVFSDRVWSFALFFTLDPVAAAGHRSYTKNNHIGKHGPDENDLGGISNFCEIFRRHVLGLGVARVYIIFSRP